MKKQETLSLPEGDEAAVQRISGALAELMPLFFPIPMPTNYSKEERVRYAKAGADFAGHAAMVLAAMPERRARESTDHFALAILAAVSGRLLTGDVIQRLQDVIQRLEDEAKGRRLQGARKAKEPNSAATDKILEPLARKALDEKFEAAQIRRWHRWRYRGPTECGAGNQRPQATRP